LDDEDYTGGGWAPPPRDQPSRERKQAKTYVPNDYRQTNGGFGQQVHSDKASICFVNELEAPALIYWVRRPPSHTHCAFAYIVHPLIHSAPSHTCTVPSLYVTRL
jgi:hypothetical protein